MKTIEVCMIGSLAEKPKGHTRGSDYAVQDAWRGANTKFVATDKTEYKAADKGDICTDGFSTRSAL